MDILDWLEAVAQAQDMAAGGKPQVERIERTAAREIVKLRAELAECKDLLRIASDFIERLPGHEGRTAFTDRIDAALAAKGE